MTPSTPLTAGNPRTCRACVVAVWTTGNVGTSVVRGRLAGRVSGLDGALTRAPAA
ncbi:MULTISPECIES: hypothetical protein [unclassified Streptomyces]|uniref:hypothetical protein n=1 Tax=unclassified Streptomyces TaxID=2593676 RepID=UPI000ACC95DC|nr:hypothetical protein OG299_38380 [Streptomyces sp. NBC_01296]